MQMDLCAQPLQRFGQRLNHIRGLVRHGKHPIAPLCLQRAARLFQECHHIKIIKSIKAAVKEFGISHHIPEQILLAAAIPASIPAAPPPTMITVFIFCLLLSINLH